MLRLLAQREEGYEDIAALKGMSVDEVRAEVKAALDALAAEPAEAAPPPPPPPEPPKAEPVAEEPPPPAPPQPREALPTRPPNRPSRPGVPPERRRLLALTGGALGIVAVVLIAIAVLGGDSDSSSAGDSGSLVENASIENDKVTQAVLEPVDGSDAAGQALFGRVGQEEVVLQVTAEGLEPSAQGESYTVWLYRSPKLALRVGSIKVGEDGQLAVRLPVPAELLAYIAGGAFNQVYVSRTADADYKREVAQAKAQQRLPRYSGETVLSGEITGPLAEAAAAQGN